MRVLVCVFLLCMFSCNFFDAKIKSDDDVIARVQNKFLLYSDILEIVPNDILSGDSALIVSNYIQNWVKDNLVLYKAELNLSDNQKNVTKQLEDYRRSLIVYAYEKELIRERLDTLITEQEIQEFYDNNTHNFELKDDIIKVRYLKVNKKAPQLKKMRKFYKSGIPVELEKLKELSHQYAEKFHLNDNRWILFEELKNEIPIKVSESKNYLSFTKNIEVEDSLYFYFAHISAFKLKNNLSPLSFERKNIKNIILNKRKLSLINKIRGDLYQEAILSKEIEIYGNKSE